MESLSGGLCKWVGFPGRPLKKMCLLLLCCCSLTIKIREERERDKERNYFSVFEEILGVKVECAFGHFSFVFVSD